MPMGTFSGIAAAAVLLFSCPGFCHQSSAQDKQVCDVPADSALGAEDYPAAIELHRRVLRLHPDNALAHYHLGFAYRMVGRLSEEIGQYRTAANLGLESWDLFLNLGLAYAEQRQLSSAAAALEHAVFLAPERSEAHFNLALIYEREGRLGDALKEINISRHLEPDDPDVVNTNAILCAETGDFLTARKLWMHLVRTAPAYSPARANIVILSRIAKTELPNSGNVPIFSSQLEASLPRLTSRDLTIR